MTVDVIGCTITGSIRMLPVSLLLDIASYNSTSMIIYGLGVAISYPVVFARSLELFSKISGTTSSVIMAIYYARHSLSSLSLYTTENCRLLLP